MASNDSEKPVNQFEPVDIQDKPVEGAGMAMDAVAAAVDNGDEVISKGHPPQDEAVDLPSEDLVDRVLQAMWSYCHAYHISNSVSIMQ